MFDINQAQYPEKRFYTILSLVFLPFLIFVYRLVDWQIINTDYYKERAQNNSAYVIKTHGMRGEIVDKDGEGIVVNSTGYRVIIDRIATPKDRENYVIAKSIELLEALKISWRDCLPITLKDEQFAFVEGQSRHISALKRFLKLKDTATAEECMDKLVKKYNCYDFTIQQQRIICSIRYNMGLTGGYGSRAFPYILADNISKEMMSVISEYSSKLQGLSVESACVRTLTDGFLAPHIIGHIGAMSPEEYETRKDTYSMDELIGKSGIEGAMEDYLRGTSGKRVLQRSRDGTVTGSLEKEAALPGNTVFLTISSKLQKTANKSLEKWVNKAREMGVSDCRAGAVVVLDVRDFSVLAAATYPTYDLNKFIKDSNYYSELAMDDENVPLLNRAFNGAFAPGSVYKPLIASAALQENLLRQDELINCNGGFSYYRGYTLKCMGRHGSINVIKALEKSCNVFFAELGRRLGATRIAKYARKFGMGIETGIELPENTGILAGPEHSEKVGSHWYESGSSQAAIGQSDNMITPLQLAVYAATIASGGNRYKTHLVKKVTNHTKNNIIVEKSVDFVENSGVSPENLDIIKQGMRQVVVSGTARDFNSFPVEIAAKTGTAQNYGSDHTTFICYAPYSNPEIAISVVVANGQYGCISKGVARDILNEYFNVQEQKK